MLGLIPDSKVSEMPTAAATSISARSIESPQYSIDELLSRSNSSSWTWDMSIEERFDACSHLFHLHRKWQTVIQTSLDSEFHSARQA